MPTQQSPYAIAAFCIITHTAGQFLLSTVTVNAANVRGFSTPAVRVTWNTTVPPECVTSVRVEFKTSSRGLVVATNTTTINTSQTEFIQTDLQCTTYYYITVVVTGKISASQRPTLRSRQVQVTVGGKLLTVEVRYDVMV